MLISPKGNVIILPKEGWFYLELNFVRRPQKSKESQRGIDKTRKDEEQDWLRPQISNRSRLLLGPI